MIDDLYSAKSIANFSEVLCNRLESRYLSYDGPWKTIEKYARKKLKKRKQCEMQRKRDKTLPGRHTCLNLISSIIEILRVLT